MLAYELLLSGGPIATGNRDEILDLALDTAGVIARVFTGQEASEALGPYRGFINVDRNFLFSELIDALPAQLVVLEILDSIAPTQEAITVASSSMTRVSHWPSIATWGTMRRTTR